MADTTIAPPRNPHADVQPAVTGPDPVNARAAVVLLHGRGASAASMMGFADVVGAPGISYIAPQAADSTWYPASFLAPLAVNSPWLESALAAVHTVVADIETRMERSRIVLLGFSQGACLALEYAARTSGRFGAVIGLSGGLIGTGDIPGADAPYDKAFEYPSGLAGTPVFLGCSDTDMHIPLPRVEQSAKVLAEAGAAVTKRIYPGMGHTVNADELSVVRATIRSVAA